MPVIRAFFMPSPRTLASSSGQTWLGHYALRNIYPVSGKRKTRKPPQDSVPYATHFILSYRFLFSYLHFHIPAIRLVRASPDSPATARLVLHFTVALRTRLFYHWLSLRRFFCHTACGAGGIALASASSAVRSTSYSSLNSLSMIMHWNADAQATARIVSR